MIFKPSKIRLIIIGYLSFHFYIVTDNNKKSHRYRHMPKLLFYLICSAILVMVAIIIISLILFHLNESYLPLHSSPLSNYANFLRTKYKSNSNPKWSPLSSEFYIPLAAVEVEDILSKDAKVFLNVIQHYSPEEILQSKTPIIFDDLLKPTQHSDGLKFVLVEGAPGIGKSTLAKEICRRWATNPTTDNHLKQFSLVILVQLRDIQHPTTLYDLLPEDPNTNMKEIERQLKLNNGRNVLWVLDGYNELPYYDKIEGFLYRRLIEGDLLNESTVLVTSQLTANGSLVQTFKRNKNRAKQIVILGFIPSNIEKYARLYFKGKPDQLQSFIDYYNSTPVIKRSMYIPLNAAIVCLVYNESYTRKLQFPTTMTELYNAFTQALILRRLLDKKQVRDDFRMPSRLMCKDDLKHLPETAQVEFWKLAKVAYDGVRTQQYIFTNSMMTGIKDNLGLMSDISVSSGTQYTSSFLCTTLQEYLAALYIANKPKEFAKEMFLLITLPLKKSWFDFPNEFTKTAESMSINIGNSYTQHIISLIQYSKNLEVVLVFYAGITGKLQIESDDHTFTVLSEPEVYSTLFARCIYESPQLSTKYQNRHLSSPSTLYMEPFDYYFVGYLISHYNISLDVEIISGDNYEFLSEGIQSSPKKPRGWLTLKNIESFHFKSIQLFQQSKVAIKGLTFIKMPIYSYINITKSFPHLQLLYYHFPISCNMICVHLQTLDHLKELTINLKGTYEELSSLMPLIKPERPIKHLKLILSYDDCPPIGILFYPSSLERLELQCNPNHAVSITNTHCKLNFSRHLLKISENKNLKELVIGYECPMIIFSLVSTIQLRSIKLEKSYMSIILKAEVKSMFLKNNRLPCSKICTHLLSFKYLKELDISLRGTHEELSSIVPLIQPGRPLRHLQLFLSLYRNNGCPPSYMLFYPSSLEKLELFCSFSKFMYLNCKVNINKTLIYQNTNLKELEISVSCPHWDTILLSLVLANTCKLRSLITYHYNEHSLIKRAANSHYKFRHHLIALHYLEKLSITINGREKEISSIVRLIQPGRPLRHLRLTLVSYSEYPPIHMLLYPSSLEKLELLCYLVNVYLDTSMNCELYFNKEGLISQNTNLEELVITTSCPCIEMFSPLLAKTKISIRS